MSAMKPPVQEVPLFSSIGGRLCLDFVNTVAHRLRPASDESLFTYGDLVAWGLDRRAITREQADALRAKAAESPEGAELAFRQALVLREAAFELFSNLIEKKDLPQPAMKMVQEFFAHAVSRMTLEGDRGTFLWVIAEADLGLSSVSWMVAHSVIEVLTSGEYKNVKRCEGIQDCGYLFHDSSKNGTRRWCSMDSCGSRAKMRALYARRNAKPVRPGRS